MIYIYLPLQGTSPETKPRTITGERRASGNDRNSIKLSGGAANPPSLTPFILDMRSHSRADRFPATGGKLWGETTDWTGHRCRVAVGVKRNKHRPLMLLTDIPYLLVKFAISASPR